MLEDPHIGFGKNVFKHNQSDCMEVTHILAGWNRGCTSHKHAIADLVYWYGNDNDGGEGNDDGMHGRNGDQVCCKPI